MSGTLTNKDGTLYIDGTEVLQGWESMSGWYWFATEMNDDGNHFGFVQGLYPEWGYLSQAELDSIPSVWKINDCDLPHAGRRD